MNYRHHFHAANFADVFKHVVLACLLDKLQEKTTPLTYIDTHAGRGLYYLKSSDTQKSKEYQFGIEPLRIYAKNNPAPVALQRYLEIVDTFASASRDRMIYPGSPKIAESFMREHDKMILCELHAEEFKYLKENMQRQDKLIGLHQADAYASLKAFLPPKTPRGLVMIDPPFEKTDEFKKITQALSEALKRWRQGVIMVWYPIKDRRQVDQFQRGLSALAADFFCIDFFIEHREMAGQLKGCGLALFNPPWLLLPLLQETIMPYLASALTARYVIYPAT